MDRLEDALNAIAACTSPEDMPAVMRRIIAELGYESFSYIDVRRSPTGAEAPFFQTTVKPAFSATYIGEGLVEHDPVAHRAARLNTPFTWADIPEYHDARKPRRGVKPRSRLVMEVAFDHGYTQGFVMPVHAIDRSGRPASAFLSLFWTERPEDLQAACPAWLRLIGLTYHERMLALRGLDATADEPPPMLTDRERDCLLWTCRGKTGSETATILGISDRTVKFHMENAMRKLGVHNKYHAIATAIQLGLIAP